MPGQKPLRSTHQVKIAGTVWLVTAQEFARVRFFYLEKKDEEKKKTSHSLNDSLLFLILSLCSRSIVQKWDEAGLIQPVKRTPGMENYWLTSTS